LEYKRKENLKPFHYAEELDAYFAQSEAKYFLFYTPKE